MQDQNKEQVEQRIKIFGELLSSIHTVFLTAYDTNFGMVSSTAPHPDIVTAFLGLGSHPQFVDDMQEVINQEVDEWVQDHSAPIVFSNSLGMVWMSEVTFEGANIERVYVLGPVFLDDYSVYHIKEELEKYKLSVPIRHIFMNYIKEIPVLSLNRFYEYGIMLHHCLTGHQISVSDFLYERTDSSAPVQETLRNFHGTYAAEQEILQLVREGNMDYKEVLDKYISVGNVGNMSDGQFLRQEKNVVIMFTTLVSRAAISGGLPSETAYDLCDTYIRRTEETQDLGSLTLLNREMFHDFVVRVHRQKINARNISPQIAKACDYICLHLNEKVDIHFLAQYLGYSDYYFSNKFKQEVGMTVRDFVMEQKVEKAKSMLCNTTDSILEISVALGYGSQSYFGEVFRKFTGMTPVEYRNKH